MTDIFHRFDDILGTGLVTYSLLSEVEYEGLISFAWVNAGVAGNINDSYNVSSVTDVGAGKIGVNYAKALPDPFNQSGSNAYYTCGWVCPQIVNSTARSSGQDQAGTQTALRSDYYCYLGAVLTDPTNWNIAIKAWKEGPRLVSP